ncbi:hypothetical protein [Kribbella deserti]|uniref:CopC domain-containing protein n=1 Tax=Kribbella deserti TaxID=1926257 RepID=A0ABV6QPY7_9ACTN
MNKWAVLPVAGLLLAGLGIRHAVAVFPHEPVAVGTSATVRVDGAALTLFASRPGIAADACVVSDGDGRPVSLLPRTGERIGSWYVVARPASPAPAGDYTVRCAESPDGTTYAVGRYGSILAFVLALFGVVAVLVVALLLAGRWRRHEGTATITG